MNIEEQLEPGPGAGGMLAASSLDDLIRELKTRCTACAVVMVVENEQGEDITLTKTLGSALVLLGACREIEHGLLHRGEE